MDLASCASRTRSKARSAQHSTLSSSRPTTWRLLRGRAPDPAFPSREANFRWTRSSAWSRTRRRKSRNAAARFLRERLAGAAAAPSTADAVRLVAGDRGALGCVGRACPPSSMGCEVLLGGVEDHPENETRFAGAQRLRPVEPVVGPGPTPAPGRSRTHLLQDLVVFWELPRQARRARRGDARSSPSAGSTSARSSPGHQASSAIHSSRTFEGSASDEAIDQVNLGGGAVDTLRVLGSYPAAGQRGATG